MVKARTQDLLSLPVCDEHRQFVYELEKQDNQYGDEPKRKKTGSNDATHLFVQTALLYTSSEGERRIRTHNLALPFTNIRAEPYENIDTNHFTNFVT